MGSITDDDTRPARDDDPTVDSGAEPTRDRRGRPIALGPALAEHVIALVLERPDARWPRQLAPRTSAVAATVSARPVDLGAGALSMEALADVAARAVAAFCERGCLVVVRPGDGPTFLFPLPAASDDDQADPVVAMCRQLDEEQARIQAVAIAQRFRAELGRAPALRGLLIEVRLGEGVIVGASARAGRLLPASVWRPA